MIEVSKIQPTYSLFYSPIFPILSECTIERNIQRPLNPIKDAMKIYISAKGVYLVINNDNIIYEGFDDLLVDDISLR